MTSSTSKSAPTSETCVALRCDLCGSEQSRHFARRFDLDYVQCSRCGFVYADVRAFDFEAFNSESMDSLRTTHLGKHTGTRHQRAYAKLLRTFARYRQTGRLLEIGSSTGGFLDQARSTGWQEYGVEPDTGSGTYSRDELGLNVHLGLLDSAEYPSDFFDVIYSNAVIEHVEAPSAVIAEAFRVLRPGGLFYANTVNLASYTRKFLGDEWKLFDPRMHLSLFTPETLTDYCERAGFEVSKIATHGVRFHATRQDRPRGWRRLTDEVRKAPYSFIARRNHKGDNIAVYAHKPAQSEISGTGDSASSAPYQRSRESNTLRTYIHTSRLSRRPCGNCRIGITGSASSIPTLQ